MSNDWPDASISITGPLEDDAALDALILAIVQDSPTLDWGGVALDDEDEIRDLLIESIQDGEALVFSENDREESDFPAITDACRKLGLSYSLSVDVDEEASTSGNTEIWTPGMEEPRSFIGSIHGDGVLLRPADLMTYIEAGDMEGLAKLVRLANDPEGDLPDALTAGPGLTISAPASAM